MRNRAKCKICNEVLESFTEGDFVTCTCKNITIGPHLYAGARDWNTFVRVDDNNYEIHVKYEDKCKEKNEQIDEDEKANTLTRVDFIAMIDEMIETYKNLPQHAMLSPVNHSDMLSLLMLISALFKSI